MLTSFSTFCVIFSIFVSRGVFIIDREAGEIIRLVASMRVCVHQFVCLNCLTFDLEVWHEGRSDLG